MSIVGRFPFRDMEIEVEVMRSKHSGQLLWLHHLDGELRTGLAFRRFGRLEVTKRIDLGELGEAELGIALDRFLAELPPLKN